MVAALIDDQPFFEDAVKSAKRQEHGISNAFPEFHHCRLVSSSSCQKNGGTNQNAPGTLLCKVATLFYLL